MQPVCVLLKIELYSEFKVQTSFKFVTGWSARLAHNSLTPVHGGGGLEVLGGFLGGFLRGVGSQIFGIWEGGLLFLLLKQFADC